MFTRWLQCLQNRWPSGPKRRELRLRRNVNPTAIPTEVRFLEPRQLLAAVVVTTTTDINDGDTSSIDSLLAHAGADGKISLREAILAANQTGGANSIGFAASLTAAEPITISPLAVADNSADNSAFAITSTLEIVGATDRNLIALKGTGPTGNLRLFRVLAGANLTLQGLTLNNWNTDTNGGVMVVDPTASVAITNCTLSHNAALSQGGAIFSLTFDGVTLTNCTLSGNHAHDGGAYNGGGQTYGGGATFVDCILTGNSAVDRGGAIALYNAGVTITNCQLIDNTAHQGGAIAGGYVVVGDSTFTHNSAIDGGAIFTGMGGGATDGSIVQVGAPGGISNLSVGRCSFNDNSARDRGGALFMVMTGGGFSNCTFAGNHAQQGGAVFQDSTELGFLTKRPTKDAVESDHGFVIRESVFRLNSAKTTGGGVFNGTGTTTLRACQFVDNLAPQGGAVYNDWGWATVIDCAVTGTSTVPGTQVFNHQGLLPLTNSTITESTPSGKRTTTQNTGTLSLATHSEHPPTRFVLPSDAKIITAPGGTRYVLTSDRILLHQLPGSSWAKMDDLVQSFQVAPNGDCYWLNDRGDLFRSQAGRLWDLIGQHVQSYAMSKAGTVFSLGKGGGPGDFAAWRSLTSVLLDSPADPPVGDEPLFCMGPPTSEEVWKATGLAGHDIQNVRVVVEPIVDRIEDTRAYPNIGLAWMHHCHYKCTVYYETALGGFPQAIIYIDKDHLIRSIPGQAAPSGQQLSIPAGTSATKVVIPSDAYRNDNIRALWTGPDGTIYKLGGDYNGYHFLGEPPAPLVLWQMHPGGNWKSLFRVYAATVAPDNTLFVLNANHVLQRLAPGAKLWTTVARDVQSFAMTKTGTVYALQDGGQLLRVQRPLLFNRWTVSTLQSGVKSYALTSDDVLLALNSRNELQRFNALTGRFVRVEAGVTTLQQSPDGTTYLLNVLGQFKRLDSQGRGTILGSQIQSIQMDADGVVYALNRGRELSRLMPGGHWSRIDVDVVSFIVAPNAFRNVYTLSSRHELKRLEAGYAWRTLRTDVLFISINTDGVVTARDTRLREWKYWSPFTVGQLDPVEVEPPLIYCVDSPDRADVLKLLQISDGPNVRSVVIEATEDTTDPPRWFINDGTIPPVRMHHCHYQCTVELQTLLGIRTIVIEIDFDHLIRAAGPATPPSKTPAGLLATDQSAIRRGVNMAWIAD